MITFKGIHVDPILKGRKIETRRNWKRWQAKIGGVHRAQTSRFDPKTLFAFLQVDERWEERLGDISQQSIYNEGYDTYEQYVAIFTEINGFWDDNLVVKVIKFHVMDEVRVEDLRFPVVSIKFEKEVIRSQL